MPKPSRRLRYEANDAVRVARRYGSGKTPTGGVAEPVGTGAAFEGAAVGAVAGAGGTLAGGATGGGGSDGGAGCAAKGGGAGA
ncbi:MAG TPA: hypothetical protein VGL19_05480, partial [Polyangiaceae bacterium]